MTQHQSDLNPLLNRRGFVTTALGAGVFVAATHSMAQPPGQKTAGGAIAKPLPHNKVFIALPGDQYYAVPEEALAPFKVELAQFNAELATKQAAEPRTPETQGAAEPESAEKTSKSGLIEEEMLEPGMTEAEKALRKLRNRWPTGSKTTAVLGVRG